MAEIIGQRSSSFTAADGTKVNGITLYIAELMTAPGATGKSAERIFLSAGKLAALDFTPTVGQTVEIFYNRYGKVASMKLETDSNVDFG